MNSDNLSIQKSKTCCPDWTPVRYLNSETSSKDSTTLQEIERALEIAEKSIESLKSTEEMLEYLVTEAKQEENKIADVINNKFAGFTASLHSRKRKLQTELVMNVCKYITDINNAKVSVEQKRNNLDTAIKVARELKTKHTSKAGYDLSQVLCNLKITVEDAVLQANNLEKRELPQFYVDSDEITAVFEKIGKFALDVPNVFGDSPLKINNAEDKFKSSASSRINRKHEPYIDEVGAVDLLQESGVCLEGIYIQHQEVTLLPTQKCAAALPQAASTPDVIIEEIIDDYQEITSAESSEEKRPKTTFKKRLMPFGPKADIPKLVFISCVITPCHFYVRTLAQKKTAVHLEKILKHFCSNTSVSPGDVLELGELIFVSSKEHGIWCRAIIFELAPLQNIHERKPCGPTKYKIRDIAMMQVFLIDFGHSEVLIVSGAARTANEVVNPKHATLEYCVTEDLCSFVRKLDLHIEAQLRDINELALHCSLKDIVPKHSSEGWSPIARTEFLRMVNNKAVLMKVFRKENGVLIVDLMKPPANKISSDMPVSLRDALVFLDLASFRTERSGQSENIEVLRYCSPVIPPENTEVTVIISHVNSPGDFYLQLLEQDPEFAFLLQKVEEVYKHEGGDNLEILCPIQGQPCVAKFEDGVWYRAQVVGLPGHQEVEVKYVDFGNTAKINVKDMCKIKDEFLASPAKAIRCKLAHIGPCKGTNEWSRKSKDRFGELVQDKRILCFVTELSQDSVLSVELYENVHVLPEWSMSINSHLVKEGLASSVTRSHSEVWDPTPEEVFKMEIDVLTRKNVDLLQTENFGLDYNSELQVRISHVVSPSKIFAQLLSSDNTLKSLQEKMTATYYESGCETVLWKVDMSCAAYVHDLDEWKRGQICRIVSENIVEVFLIDSGVAKTVNTDSLRKLEENLKRVEPLAVECSLADIRPTGGTDQWTATARDVLARYLTGAVVNIIIQENNTSPLPVKILNKDGGLYTDISEYMIKEGLAFRKKRAHKIDSSTVTPEKPHEMPCQQVNVDTNHLLAETECTLSLSVPEKEADRSAVARKEQELETSVAYPRMVEIYKPPAIPVSDHFNAIVSCVADNGTIYVIPKSQEQLRSKLMSDIQSNFKCLGLLEPYCWEKGEACVVRAEDTMWYRGEVIEAGGGIIRVQYLDYGYIEKIPQCHLYPTVLHANTPPFAIPCQLYKTVPVGNIWQQDAVELLQELLTERLVEIHIMEQSDDPWGNVYVKLFFAGISLSSFMAYHKHCISEEDDGNIPKLDMKNCGEDHLEENCEISYEELLISEADTPLLPPYIKSWVPPVGESFPVKVKHVVVPNEMYLVLDQPDNPNHYRRTEDSGTSWDSDSETLDEALTLCNRSIQSYPPLTDFRQDMPCLAKYMEGSWHRAKLLSIKEFSPVSILVQFIDYGTSAVLHTSRLRQIPPHLIQYPAQAFKVLLNGFEPSLYDSSEVPRIPYCPEWSKAALWAMMDCINVKNLSATSLMHSPEHVVCLYEDGHLVHKKLVEMGFAVLS